MKGFDAKFLEELKNKNEIVDVCSKYVTLEQRGDSFWGRCPFHHEKTASFCINARGQFFYCFGCHKSGDVITLIMELESLDFNDAVKFLAEKAKIPLPEVKIDDEKIKEQKRKKERTYALLRDTALFYVHNLRSDKADKHIEYVNKRGISKDGLIKFGIGASLDFSSLCTYLKKKGYTEEEMLLSGAVDVKDGRYYDSLGGRLIIPIINQFGQVIAFGGRLLEKADFAKYKNTKETLVFSKSNTLYNLNNVKKLKNETGLDGIIIVEGYMDTISLVEAGFYNVVASMGTSLTKDQARILKRYTEKVYISYDGDFAGQKAAIRGLEILKEEGLDVKVVSMPNGLDPDDVIKKFGYEGYKQLLDNAMPLIDFKIDVLKKSYDLSSVDGKRKFTSSAIKVIKESDSHAEQEDLLKTVRDLTGFTLDSLKRDLYSNKVEKQKVEVVKEDKVKIGFSETESDKGIVASRYILASYLNREPFALETDISALSFFQPIHKEIKGYIESRIKEGKSITFADIYGLFEDGETGELDAIASVGANEFTSTFDKARYFSDCVKVLKTEGLEMKLNLLREQVKNEPDLEKRREIMVKINALIVEKRKA